MENNLQVQNQNGVVTPAKKTPFSVFMQNAGNKLVANTLSDPNRKQQFVANLVSAVSSNPTLAECEQVSIVSAALQAEALHFPINNSLGYVYLVPFSKKEYNPKTRKREEVCKIAQFQIGYKGYIQLAIRSGQYKNINVVEVKEGELGSYDPLNGQTFNWVTDYQKRKNLKTIGYAGQFELVNGFKQSLYISFEEMLDHADTYSQAFDKEIYTRLQNGEVITDEKGKDMSYKYSSFWYKDFDEMGKKTVLRQLLSKWGIMSVEMQEAYTKDQAAMEADGSYNYVDANTVEVQQVNETGTINPDVEEESQAPTPEAEPQETNKKPTQDDIFKKHMTGLKNEEVDF